MYTRDSSFLRICFCLSSLPNAFSVFPSSLSSNPRLLQSLQHRCVVDHPLIPAAIWVGAGGRGEEGGDPGGGDRPVHCCCKLSSWGNGLCLPSLGGGEGLGGGGLAAPVVGAKVREKQVVCRPLLLLPIPSAAAERGEGEGQWAPGVLVALRHLSRWWLAGWPR